MEAEYRKLIKCYEGVRKKINFQPKVALVLGSGLGSFGDKIDVRAVLDYSELDEFPISTVQGHDGRFLFGYVGEVPVVCMQGRVHYYEGYSMDQVVMPARLMHMLGAEVLFLTNAAGGINLQYRTGDFMMIQDHISCFIRNPLIGENITEFGTRFPDMTRVYDEELQQVIRNTANECGIALKEGVYVQLSGPSFETPQEIKMLRTMGADAVGMSTVCEAIAGRHCGMRVCGISFISNQAAGIGDESLSALDVKQAASQVEEAFSTLVKESIRKMQ